MMNESSMDYVAKFADLAAQIASTAAEDDHAPGNHHGNLWDPYKQSLERITPITKCTSPIEFVLLYKHINVGEQVRKNFVAEGNVTMVLGKLIKHTKCQYFYSLCELVV